MIYLVLCKINVVHKLYNSQFLKGIQDKDWIKASDCNAIAAQNLNFNWNGEDSFELNCGQKLHSNWLWASSD